MESHPSFPTLAPLLVKYPRSSASLFQTYNDIVYAQQWTSVDAFDLESCARGAIKGKKKDGSDTLYVVPCALSETLSFGWLKEAFKTLFPPSNGDSSTASRDLASIYLAITSSDASIVYYKLSEGIVKPAV